MNQSRINLQTQINFSDQYFHVSKLKFIILSICSFSIYEIYWFYKNWTQIKITEKRHISPFWRAIFAPLWCYSLLTHIDGSSTEIRLSRGLITAFYFILTASWRLPDPYWLLSFFSFVPLIFAVNAIDKLYSNPSDEQHKNSHFSIPNLLLTIIGGTFVIMTSASTLKIIPDSMAISGDALWQKDVNFLKQQGLLDEDERIIYFYSGGFFSYKEDGNYFTNKRVVSYWWDDESNTLKTEMATYDEIDDISAELKDGFMEDSQISIRRKDGSEFIIIVSNDENSDEKFFIHLKDEWKTAMLKKNGNVLRGENN